MARVSKKRSQAGSRKTARFKKQEELAMVDAYGIDESIYLFCLSEDSETLLWYLIEDKKRMDDHDLLENNINIKLTEKGSIDEVVVSETDRIRALRLPVISPHIIRTRLAFSNSCVYLIGASKYVEDIGYEVCSDVKFCDLKNPMKGWQNSPSLYFPAAYQTVFASKDGSILTHFNYSTLQGDSLWLSGEGWKQMPKPPSEVCKEFDHADLLALTDTKGFWSSPGSSFRNFCLTCFDFENSHWKLLAGMPKEGRWFRGVLLFSDTYLFIYGHPDFYREKDNEKFYLYGFDLVDGNRKFLPVKVDEKFLPPMNDDCFLFQVNYNKLAFVWRVPSQGPKSCDLMYWTKLTIHKDYDGDGELIFRAEVFSHGHCVIDGKMIDCATPPYAT